MKREEMLERAKQFTSGDNEKKSEKAFKKIIKIYDKKDDNEYTQARDLIVFCFMLLYAVTDLDGVALRPTQRAKLEELIDGLFEKELEE